MANASWGHCRTCRFFDSPARIPLEAEEARCQQQELSRFGLTVFGASGCNAWELREGLPEDIEQQPAAIAAG